MQIICTSLQTDTMPAPHCSIFYRLEALPDDHQTASKHGRQIFHPDTHKITNNHHSTSYHALDIFLRQHVKILRPFSLTAANDSVFWTTSYLTHLQSCAYFTQLYSVIRIFWRNDDRAHTHECIHSLLSDSYSPYTDFYNTVRRQYYDTTSINPIRFSKQAERIHSTRKTASTFPFLSHS